MFEWLNPQPEMSEFDKQLLASNIVAAKKLFDDLKGKNHFKHLTKMDFVKSAATFMNGLNILHPFREGNGRKKESMIQASVQGAKGNTKDFETMIKNHIQSKQKNLFPLRNNEKGLKI